MSKAPLRRSRSSRWLCAGCALLLAVLPQVRAGSIELPDMGASAGSLMSQGEEQQLGKAFMRGVRRVVTVVEDPLLADYIEDLGQRLAQAAQRGRYQFSFFLADSPQVNAFAGPAGHIGIFSGLVLTTESESELASVLAHEIAHVTQEHLLRSFESAKNLTLPAAAMLLAAVVLGATTKGDVGAAAVTGISAGLAQQQINFTRDNEQEADRVGIQILAAAGFDPRAMAVFFDRMNKTSRLYENKAPEFLRTHPVNTSRIADALGRADSFPQTKRSEDYQYHLIRAALRVRGMTNPKEAVNHFAKTLKDGHFPDEDGERYGYALALLKDRQYQAAAAQVGKLIAKRPSSIAYNLVKAKIEKESGQAKQAMTTVGTALELFPGNYPLSQFFAELLVQNGQASRAIKVLDRAIEQRPDKPALYELRSRAYLATGNQGNAHLDLAESHYLNGQLEKAVQQLQAALKSDKLEFYDASRIQAKLRELRDELVEEKKAERKG